MEFVDGGQVNDRDYMERNKIDVNEVSLSAHGSCAGTWAWSGPPTEGRHVPVRSHCLEMESVV